MSAVGRSSKDTPSTAGLVLGIDGGGTKTVAWLAPLADNAAAVLGRGAAGSGNPRAAGFDAAQANIAAAIGQAFADARLPRATVAAACFGLAGAGRAEEQEQIAAWARRERIADCIVVTDDAQPVLAAASPDCVGIALISGTGSLAFGRNDAGHKARCGGWGYLLGDEGSGYAIGLAGLRAAVRCADGRGPATVLLDRMQQALGAAAASDLVDRVYHADMTRERIAALSSVVFQAAADDAVARAIVEAAAAELAAMVRTVQARLQLPVGQYPLALAGGVLVNNDLLRHGLLRQLQDRNQPPQAAVIAEPVRGALALARRAVQ